MFATLGLQDSQAMPAHLQLKWRAARQQISAVVAAPSAAPSAAPLSPDRKRSPCDGEPSPSPNRQRLGEITNR